MKTAIRWWRASLCTLALYLGATCPASAIIYDLTSDWSNISNPNGVWSLNEGANPISPFQAPWDATSGQGAWAARPFSQTGHVPAWLKVANQSFIDRFAADLLVGDVTVHGRCCSDLSGTGEANVTWTSDVAGVATISGATWWGGFPGRNVDWSIFVNGSLVTGGNVGDGDAFDRSNPFNFADGSGGASVLSFNTTPGDVVKFEARKGATSPFDHFIGVDLKIEVAPSIPEPVTIALMAIGIVGFAVARRSRSGTGVSEPGSVLTL